MESEVDRQAAQDQLEDAWREVRLANPDHKPQTTARLDVPSGGLFCSDERVEEDEAESTTGGAGERAALRRGEVPNVSPACAPPHMAGAAAGGGTEGAPLPD